MIVAVTSAFFVLFFSEVSTSAETKHFNQKAEIVEFNWGNGGPAWDSNTVDNFTVDFDQSQHLENGNYFIQTFADDGVTVDVNGKRVIDRWAYSYISNINRALLPNVSAGTHNILTKYREGVKSAAIYSHVVPFDSWLAYYYPNLTTSSIPVAAKIIQGTPNGGLEQNYGSGSPVPERVAADNFSVSFTTAKKLAPGDYVIRAGADDGVQVYIDGKLVINRFNYSGSFKEDAVKVKINNNEVNGENHWIEVRYKDVYFDSKINVEIQPYSEVMNITSADGWVGEVFPKSDFTGNSIILGGKSAIIPVGNLDYNWGAGSPSTSIPNDYFSARFSRKLEIANTGMYSLSLWADDNVRLYVDGKKVIDSWKYVPGGYRNVKLPLTKGTHDIKVEYYENILNARVKFGISEIPTDFSKAEKSLYYNWGLSGPVSGKYDNFTAKFDQSQMLDGGDYLIQTLADDGIIVEVNGEEKINRWSYSPNLVNRAYLTNLQEGNHSITTLYREGSKTASLLSNIVPFGDWLAYYYPNESFAGIPVASKVLEGNGSYSGLKEFNWQESPVPGVVPKDHFTAKYVSAKRIPAGDYVLKTGADDGLQVYIDGKLVLDRFTPVGYREDSVQVNIRDLFANKTGEKDIHIIEVKYKEGKLSSRVNVDLLPVSEVRNLSVEDGWIGEIYNNTTFSGNPVFIGGKTTDSKIQDLNLNWGNNAPSPLVRNDYFATRFTRKVNITEPGYYVLNAWADDGVRVYVDGEKKIDSWDYESNNLRQAGINLTQGVHEIKVEHYDGKLGSQIKFALEKGKTVYNSIQKEVAYNWGLGSPHVEVQPDDFTATFDQSQYLNAGDYFIQTFADDGVTVDFNNSRVIDRWNYSSDSLVNKAIVNVSAGEQKVITNYKEGNQNALVFSHVVPFGDWLAYYYQNQTLSGTPIAAKVLKAGTNYGALVENNGSNSPVPGKVEPDNFSARYVTTKRIAAGDYVLRTGADDGVQVFIDGELIVDRFTNGGFREDSVKVRIDNINNSNIHTIEVRYKEASQGSRVEAFLQPYSEAKDISTTDGWYAEFYNNRTLDGNPVIMGGKHALKPIQTLDYYWGQDAPSPFIQKDNFSARFTKKVNITEPGDYAITVHADDGVRVKVDGVLKIDSWQYVSGKKRQITLDLTSGVHEIVVEYYDGELAASLKFELDKVAATSYIEVDLRKISNITAQDIVDFFNRKKPESLLKNYAQDFIDVQNKTGVNAQYLVAHAIWETGWGSSTLTKYKRNFFGYGAYDSCPFTCAYYFPTGFDSINYVAYQVKTDYLTSNGKYYNGPTLTGMNVRYATDQNWKNGIASLMEQIKPFDAQYYDKKPVSTIAPPKPPAYSRDIPSGQPVPPNMFINYPAGIKAIVVNTENLNFRSLPYATPATLIKQISKGTEVTVIGHNADVKGDWYRVNVGGTLGWLSGDYLDVQNLLKVSVSSGTLNIRSTPNGSVLKAVNNGTYLKIVLDSSSKYVTKTVDGQIWYNVNVPGMKETGWVSGEFASIIK
ncbi:PA14 domain-containing protein [Bacillus suaedaesalsae]|uniref:Glucosaminidase domain-containing protein n=1 Tax=Bacillus suaedaesalsae TaxID=2810349 RepID=A0ABS2DKQ8_9BACI|nr:PA14 domain-containing protein [Bacillus suaedaesalsae]MBM6619086.1 glucosaminidase domain-containing protein [Bacillus suaedaesalsae]